MKTSYFSPITLLTHFLTLTLLSTHLPTTQAHGDEVHDEVTTTTNPNCALSDPITLSDTTNLTFRYYSTSTTLTVEMQSSSPGYIALALSEDGLMLEKEAVIGVGIPFFEAAKYDLLGKSLPGVQKMAESHQSLLNATFSKTEDGDGRILRFTKLLKDHNTFVRDQLDANGEHTFMWAIGGVDSLDYHLAHGLFDLTLAPCDTVEDDEDGGVNSGVTVQDIKNANCAYVAHGILALLAVVFFLPIGISSAAARSSSILQQESMQNKPKWMVIHQICNGLSFVLMVTLFFVAFGAQFYESKENTDSGWNGHLESTHHKMGYSIMVLMTVQVVVALFRPKKSDSSGSSSGAAPETSDAVEEGFENEPTSVIKDDNGGDGKPSSSSSLRRIWELKHWIFGYTLFALSLYQCHSGLIRLTLKGYKDYTTVLWIWVPCFLVFLIGGVLYLKRK